MNLNERYKVRHKNRYKRFLLFYSFLVFSLFIYNSLARYTAITENTGTVDIALWNIKINSETIENNAQQMTNVLKLVPNENSNTTQNKLAPGQSGYFDISINPEETEVSVEYSIFFDTTLLPSEITITGYKKNENETIQTITNNTISGEIVLDSSKQKLTSSNTDNYRIYWMWDATSNTEFPTENINYSIIAKINIQQKI